jgi:hypothetical protein
MSRPVDGASARDLRAAANPGNQARSSPSSCPAHSPNARAHSPIPEFLRDSEIRIRNAYPSLSPADQVQ